jgi:hypothetical protein
MIITDLPEDVLYIISEFLSPKCYHVKKQVMTEMSKSIPELSRLFLDIPTTCKKEEHITFRHETICVNILDTIINDRRKSSYYMTNVISKIVNELENCRLYRPIDDVYTFHFPNDERFTISDPLIQFIETKILGRSNYNISHMCCSGNGLFIIPNSHYDVLYYG